MDDEEADLQKDWAEEDNVIEETVLKTTAEDNTAGVKVENIVKLMRSGEGALLDESATMSVLPERSEIPRQFPVSSHVTRSYGEMELSEDSSGEEGGPGGRWGHSWGFLTLLPLFPLLIFPPSLVLFSHSILTALSPLISSPLASPLQFYPSLFFSLSLSLMFSLLLYQGSDV